MAEPGAFPIDERVVAWPRRAGRAGDHRQMRIRVRGVEGGGREDKRRARLDFGPVDKRKRNDDDLPALTDHRRHCPPATPIRSESAAMRAEMAGRE